MVFGTRDNGRDRPSAYRTSNDRERVSERNRHSPSLKVSSSRYDNRYDERYDDRYDDHRSRRDESVLSSKCFSSFYRERFGSHSPEDYRNLRISQFDRSLSKNEIRNLLEKEFKQFMPFEIKIVHNPENDERLAYVNFDKDNCAKTIRRCLIPRLQKVLGRRLALDPTGVIRDQDGKYIPDRFNRAVMAAERDTHYRDRSPRDRRDSSSRDYSRSRSKSPDNHRISGNKMGRPLPNKYRDTNRDNPFVNLNQDDTQATRTLYIGNLPGDVRESEIRRVFEVYGTLDEIDIKVLSNTAAFAFVLYRTVEHAVEARNCQNNMPIRPGSTRCQIGYSKTHPTNCLYVGCLGSWATRDMLESEFDRYGAIDEIEYPVEDSGGAYIRFADLDSATDACAGMKNFELTKGKFITVDFAKDIGRSEKNRKRARSQSGGSDSKRSHVDDRCWSPTTAGYIETLDDLREEFACTWKGCVTLKKIDYPLSFHRVFGKEHLLQDYLRDDAGNSLKLNITQRVKLDQSFYQEHIELGSRELALIIASYNNSSAEKVTQYLQDKSAAGLVILENCTVHFLPHSVVAERLLKFFAPRIALLKPNSNYMLIVLRKLRKDKKRDESDSSQKLTNTSRYSDELNPPPPPLPSRAKADQDDDKLEQMHQERLQMKNKVETASTLLATNEQDLSNSITVDSATVREKNDKNNGNGRNDDDDRRHRIRRSRSDSEAESSSSSSDDEEGRAEEDEKSNADSDDNKSCQSDDVEK